MSRYGGGRPPGDDLAYGELPQRWDRSRFERFGGGPPPRQFEEDYRFHERDTPRQRDVQVQDRIDERGPRGRYEERDRYAEEDRFTPAGRRRRTDRELFGDVDPRELANMAVTPYRGGGDGGRGTRDEIDIDIDINRGAPPRPGLMRRQSSLDTFDRRPIPRYEREEYRIPAYQPVPLPIRREEGYDDFQRGGYNEPEEYREVEIRRERSVHRRGGGPKSSKSSKAKSVTTRRSSSSSSSSDTTIQDTRSRRTRSRRAPSIHESFHEDIHGPGGLSIHESFHESVHGGSVSDSITQIEKKFKKGKTRMPKRLVRREAIMDLGYPFDEEVDFFVLRIALEKEQIDEVMKISESYKNEDKKVVYKYEDKVDEAPALLAPPNEHEEVIRTEWINPPSVAGVRRSASRSEYRGRRDSSPSGASTTTRRLSPARTARSHRTSHSRHHSQPPPPQFYEEHKTVIEERAPSNAVPPPPPPMAPPAPAYYEERKTVVEERGQPASHYHDPHYHHHHSHNSNSGALIVQERESRSDRDIQAEIGRLEAERRALRLEREADERRNMAVRIRERPTDEYQLVEYEPHKAREVLDVYEREKSPPRNVVRVEKDRKEKAREARAKKVALAMATLT
ncbi:uncharacterized protein LTR77_007899 [Saxophila tyrrhenica]|uniref:DUF8035 domain-containing protein n=1 Tax=Saxophila tyrrhenica TaxID=1690608 RepID=A0AAV9P5C7_9PEZI|nr:hypothetical protein LTR77_007899 [Saxophila tyrrhenica]